MTNVAVDSKTINKEQLKAIRHGSGPLMIIAGAGTGKTTVITERIKYLIASKKAKPTEILALTFTEKAAKEMEERVDSAMPYGVTQMWISTFHAFCDRILRAEAIHVGMNPAYTLMGEADAIMFFRKHMYAFELSYFRPLGNPTKFIAGMIQHFSRLKDEDISSEKYLNWVNHESKDEKEALDKYLELANAYKTYEELKIKEGVCDYSDLISHTLHILRARPHIRKQYQDQFTYILIDEFQDTNFAQNELAILLAGKRKNITVVGDDDQAIYRWRGAAISNMIQFRSRFAKTKIVVLTKNYRSTKEILDRSYELIQNNNPDRLEVAEKIDKRLESMRRVNGTPATVLFADRVEYEAELVAEEIKKLIDGGTNYQWSDCAILVRANSHAEPFARAFARAGIPYQFSGPGQLYRQPEVKDLIAYLKVLYNFEDNVAMFRVLSMEWLSIVPRDIAAISNNAKKYGISIFEVCELLAGMSSQIHLNVQKPSVSDETIQKITQLILLLHKQLGLLKKETAGQILYYFLEESGLLKKLAEYTNTKDERIAGNISKFFQKLKTYETEHEDSGVFPVVDWIDLSLQLGESPSAMDMDLSLVDAVRIMTIHSSKGLEFPIVFLVNLVSQRFPTTERKEQIPVPDELIQEVLPVGDIHLQEERRLFYVGMTRARDLLYYTAAKYYGEGKREKKLSLYLQEAIGISVQVPEVNNAQKGSTQLSFLDYKKIDPPETKEKIKQKISYVSYSQLSSFTQCPLQYKYRYIVKIPVPASAALLFGDIMHKTIQAFYGDVMKRKYPTKDDLVAIFENKWSSINFGNRSYEEKMMLHGIELLNGFYEKSFVPDHIPLSLEEPFKIKITPTLTLGGKIDRIDSLPDGTLEIIDYKTGTAPKTRDVSRDEQLSIYALSVVQEGIYKKPPEKVIVSFYFFEGQEKISDTRTLDQLESIKAEVAKTVDTIERSEFTPTPGRHCDFCEFRLICEAWN